MYDIRPTVPSFSISIPSYSSCAILIVFLVVKDSLFAASCCSILVVKGLGADFLLVLASIEFTTISLSFISSKIEFTISSFGNSILSLDLP